MNTNTSVQFWALLILANVSMGSWSWFYLVGAVATLIVSFWLRD